MLSEKLKQFRTDKGISLYRLSIKSGVNRGTLHKIETGKRLNPGWKILKRLSEALEVSIEQLVSEGTTDEGNEKTGSY